MPEAGGHSKKKCRGLISYHECFQGPTAASWARAGACGKESAAILTELSETFRRTFEGLRGQAYDVADDGEAAARVAAICEEAGAACVALGTLPPGLASAVRDRLEPAGFRVLTPPYPAEALPDLLDEAQVGVTAAEYAIAETGTLVEVATNDAERLVSSLPRIHVGVVRTERMIPKLFDAAPLLRETFAAHAGHCAVSFISGPSRTGDIELKLTLGVHGPEQAHAILIGGEAGHGG